MKVAYFQPTVLAIDNIPPVEFSKIFNLAETLHSHPELNEIDNPMVTIRGGQQINVYPNALNLDVTWLVKWLETICQGYMEIVTAQSGTTDLKYCKPVITNVWTVKQTQGQYQEMHSHPAGNISGNLYLSAPELAKGSMSPDSQILFRLPQSRDVSKFIMTDTWKYNAQPGTVIVYPSHLPHTVYPWQGMGNRTVMSFDARLVPIDE